MKETNHEIRVYDFSKAENREYAPRIADESKRLVEGYSIVFNQRSRVLYDRTQRKYFIEVIDPRSVTIDFLNNQDIKFVFNHSNDALMARSIFGSGTLRYTVDDYGVKYSFEMPNTTVGNDVLEMIRRGDVFGCSFAFTYAKDGVRDEKKDGQNLRTVIKMDSIHDFSIVVDPAYLGTYVVSKRAFEDIVENDNEGCPAEIDMALAEIDLM